MGGLPAIALESLQRMVLPDTPPGLASPSASSFSSRSSPSTEQAAWGPRAAAPLFSMAHYDKPSSLDKSIESSTEANPSRPESSENASSRQQLPSLSSLFGPSTLVRTANNSPHLDGPAPFLSQSPLERPKHPSGVVKSTPLFLPSLSPASQPRTIYDVKYDAERQNFPPTSFPGPRSPGYRDLNHSRSDSRYDSETSKWSMHQENRHEYLLGSRASPYQSPGDRFRHHVPRTRGESLPTYPDQRPGHFMGASTNPPPTPASTVGSASDLTISVSKDGLGPKIWTGTHFLPRFVRASEVPGEGLCYFYDDGTHCKTVIDGEAVNAHWGVTKAGKPRKRLAIACVTCREKKIKCDPDYPRCVQCEKFGRICKFKNAPRGGHNTSPSTPPAELDDGRPTSVGATKPGEFQHSMSDVGSPTSPHNGARPSTPEEGPSKRLKVGPQAFVSVGEPSVAPHVGPMDRPNLQAVENRPALEMPQIPDSVLYQACRTDPYLTDPEVVPGVITQFFAKIDSSMIIRFFPKDLFKNWVSNHVHRKTPEDFMLLYSVLAVGLALSNSSEQMAYEFAQVAHFAQRTLNVECLQLVQTRILLAVYYVATGRHREADQLISYAIAASSSQQLHVELENSREATQAVYPFGMNRAGYAESRRRTFWALFMLERLSGYFPDRPLMINAEDVYMRLPSDASSFDRQVESYAPMFEPCASSFSRLTEQPLDIAGYLVELVHIWSESQAFIQRMALRPSPAEAEAGKLRNLIHRAEEWHATLPSRLKFGGSNLESAAFSGNVGSFLSTHMLYRHLMIKLHRHRHGVSQMSMEVRNEYLQECQGHATSIVEMLGSLDRVLKVRPTLLETPPPAMAFAVTEALDVLSAAGLMTALPDLVAVFGVARSAVERMIEVWKASSRSLLIIDQRMQRLERIRNQGSRPATPDGGYRLLLSSELKDRVGSRWQILDPIETRLPLQMDILYFMRT